MKHRLAAPFFAVLVLALAAFTGSALAGGGQGNGGGSSNGNSANAPGHQTTQAPAAPAAAPAKNDKQSSTSASNPATGGSNANGVKPSNTTKHDTYAKASSDQTKKYGNGKTAGQIATQAGYGDATLHGPGNSQPHKVLCGGHEVDVHALKNKGSKCGTTTPPASSTQNSQSQSSNCTTTTRTVTEQVLVGINHKTGNGKFVLIHPSANSAHYSKHADDVAVYETVTKTESVPTGTDCSSTTPTVISTQTSGPTVAPATSASVTPAASSTAAGSVLGTQATLTPAAASSPTATSATAGGVKGAVVALKPTKKRAAGGVLGTTTRLGGTIAATRLPFTGLPLWIFALIAAGLIGVGLTMRRASANRI